jgi:hypothetical protein
MGQVQLPQVVLKLHPGAKVALAEASMRFHASCATAQQCCLRLRSSLLAGARTTMQCTRQLRELDVNMRKRCTAIHRRGIDSLRPPCVPSSPFLLGKHGRCVAGSRLWSNTRTVRTAQLYTTVKHITCIVLVLQHVHVACIGVPGCLTGRRLMGGQMVTGVVSYAYAGMPPL